MGTLSVAARTTVRADPPAVWALLADANAYPRWGPWSEGGYRPAADGPSEPGRIQWFRHGRTVSVEEVLEVEAPNRLTYRVVSGIPMRNYRAEVTLTAEDGGTTVDWRATFDRTLVGRLVQRRLQAVYDEVVTALAAAAVSGAG